MARRVALSFLTTGVLVCGSLAAAQPAPQPANPPALLAQAQNMAHVTLGQAAVPLYGPWKFAIGDSPIDSNTGQPICIDASFDALGCRTVERANHQISPYATLKSQELS